MQAQGGSEFASRTGSNRPLDVKKVTLWIPDAFFIFSHYGNGAKMTRKNSSKNHKRDVTT